MAHSVPFFWAVFYSLWSSPAVKLLDRCGISLFRQQLLVLPCKLVAIPLLAYATALLLFPAWAGCFAGDADAAGLIIHCPY